MDEEEKVVSENDLEWDGEITLLKGKPFTGVCVDYYKNGQKVSEVHYKDGREEGLWTEWSKDGEKTYEGPFRDGVVLEKDGKIAPISRRTLLKPI
mgnify:CR=1 FL=1